MAGIVTLCGALLGFVFGLAGYLVFDFGFLTSFAIWAFSGPVSAILAYTLPTQGPRGRVPADPDRTPAMQGRSAETA